MNKIYSMDELATAPLDVDAIYEGGAALANEPLYRLPGCANRGGFRKVGRGTTHFVVLHTTLADRDWPDYLDVGTGIFTYYGDNKKPGHMLEDTPQHGNRLLTSIFSALHADPPQRTLIPPFFVFSNALGHTASRAVQFPGLAVPGAESVAPTDDLVAIWKSTGGNCFQNYRALFTILDVPRINRAWIDELRSGVGVGPASPPIWRQWVTRGRYTPSKPNPQRLSALHGSNGPTLARKHSCSVSITTLKTARSNLRNLPRGLSACSTRT